MFVIKTFQPMYINVNSCTKFWVYISKQTKQCQDEFYPWDVFDRIIWRRFQRTMQAFSEPSQKKHSIEWSSERNKVLLKATLAIRY